MNIDLLIEKFEEQFKNKAPFACYSSPNSKILNAVFQTDDVLYDKIQEDDTVFILAPFNLDNPPLCIPRHKSEQIASIYDFQPSVTEETTISDSEEERLKHTHLVSQAVHVIEKNICKKIVVSRKKKVFLKTFDLASLLKNLLSLYPEAFRYIWFHPETGLWCGASPEILLVSDKTSFKTMALAGTQKMINGQLRTWTPKEVMEQRLVTQVMAQRLQKITSILRISKMYTHKAGTVAHIRTDLEGVFKKSRFTPNCLASVLHPTPAVCGTPTEVAVQFIQEKEGYDRSYYTGFVGTIDAQREASNLYVNLRCMHIEGQTASLFVGGGITADSEEDAEWEETQHKLQTMAKVIQPFL